MQSNNNSRTRVGSTGVRSHHLSIERRYFDAFGSTAPSGLYKSKRYSSILNSLEGAIGNNDGEKEIRQHKLYEEAMELGEFDEKDVELASRPDPHVVLSDERLKTRCANDFVRVASERTAARNKINNSFVAVASVLHNELFDPCPISRSASGALSAMPPKEGAPRASRGYLYKVQLTEEAREAAHRYMRSRNGFALASAMRFVHSFRVGEQRAICEYVSSNISEKEVRSLVNTICKGQFYQDAREAVLTHAHPLDISVHSQCLDKHYDTLTQNNVYDRLFGPGRALPAVFVQPQGLFDHGDNMKEALGVYMSAVKGAWKCLKKIISKMGLTGTLISIVFIFKLLQTINIKVNRWVLYAIIGLCNCAHIRTMIEDTAEIITTGVTDYVAGQPDHESFYNAYSNCAARQGHVSEQRKAFDSYNINQRKHGLETVSEEEFYADCEPQGGFVKASLASALMFMIGKRVPLYSKIVNVQKFRAGVDEMLDGGIDAFEKLVNFILRSFGSKRVLDFKREQSAVKVRATKVELFCSDARGGGLKLDEHAHQKYMEFYAECTEEVTKWPRDSREWRCASKTLETLVKLSTDYPAHFSEASARVEPIGLMMEGSPGIGKTYLLTNMAKIISYYEKPTEEFDMSRCTFQKPTGQYWEGYKGQLVLCMDDVFTKAPVAGEQESDAETVVKLINQWPLSLNMANCALKGRFYMTSPYVLATTNLTDVSKLSKAVVDSKAITRRFPLWFKVSLKEGKKCEPGCDFDDTWDFYAKDHDNTDSGCLQRYSFTDVMTMLFRERKRRLEFFDATMGNNGTCKAFAESVKQVVDAVPQGAAMSAASGVATIGRKVAFCVGLASGCAYAGTKIALGVARRGLRKDLSEAGEKVIAITGKLLFYSSATVLGLTIALKVAKSFSRKNNKVEPVKVEPQARRDEVLELVQRNMFKIFVGGLFCGYGLGLDDMTLVVPNHFATTAAAKNATMEAVSSTGYKVKLIKMTRCDETTDQAFFRAKTQCKSLTSAHVSSAPGEKRVLIVFPDKVIHAETTHEPTPCNYADHKGAPVRARKLYSHTACLDLGDCGAVVMGATGRFGRRVYGMHTAGALDRTTKYAGRFSVFNAADCVPQGAETYLGHKVIEILDYPVHNGGDTRLEPTPYAGVFDAVKTAPSAKRPRKGVDPLVKAIEGYKREWGPVPPEINACVDAVMAEIHTCIKGYDVGPVTDWEAAAGISGEPYSKGLARGKSPGYPFILKYKDKKSMLGSEGEYVKGPAWGELQDAVDKLRVIYKRGGKGAVFRDSLKDEPRAIEKVEAANTRMISGCAVEMCVLGRTQTLRYTSALMQTRHDHGMMPGFNPFSLEAGQLYDRLAYMNSKQHVTAGDYKAFDKSQHPVIMRRIWDNIVNYLVANGCDRDVLEGLGRDTINARHLGGNSFVSDVIYEVDGTLPSGHWMTSLLNSMYNAVVLRYCWVKYAGMHALFDFRKNVAAVYYGDDFVIATNDKHSAFNLTLLQERVTDLGLTMTDEEGNPGGEPSKHVHEVTFLCRNFRIDERGGVWMPLQLDSINDMFNWKKRSTTIEEHTEAVSRACLMEVAAHDLSTFRRYYRAVCELCNKHGVRMFECGTSVDSAYSHWRIVNQNHIPVWTPEDE